MDRRRRRGKKVEKPTSVSCSHSTIPRRFKKRAGKKKKKKDGPDDSPLFFLPDEAQEKGGKRAEAAFFIFCFSQRHTLLDRGKKGNMKNSPFSLFFLC